MFLSDDLTTQVGTLALVPQIVQKVKLPGHRGRRHRRFERRCGGDGARRRRRAGRDRLPAVRRGRHERRAPRRAQKRGRPPHGADQRFHGPPRAGHREPPHEGDRPDQSRCTPFPLAASALAPLRAKAESLGSGDFSPLWAGQNTSGCKEVVGRRPHPRAGRRSLKLVKRPARAVFDSVWYVVSGFSRTSRWSA